LHAKVESIFGMYEGSRFYPAHAINDVAIEREKAPYGVVLTYITI